MREGCFEVSIYRSHIRNLHAGLLCVFAGFWQGDVVIVGISGINDSCLDPGSSTAASCCRRQQFAWPVYLEDGSLYDRSSSYQATRFSSQ